MTRAGISLEQTTSRKESAADLAIVEGILSFVLHNKPPHIVILISGDSDFARSMRFLTNSGFETGLIHHEKACSKALVNSVIHRFPLREGLISHTYPRRQVEYSTRDRWQSLSSRDQWKSLSSRDQWKSLSESDINSQRFPVIARELVTNVEKAYAILLQACRLAHPQPLNFGKWCESLNNEITMREMNLLEEHVESAKTKGVVCIKRIRTGQDRMHISLTPSFIHPTNQQAITSASLGLRDYFTELVTSLRSRQTLAASHSETLRGFMQTFSQDSLSRKSAKKLLEKTLEIGTRKGVLSHEKRGSDIQLTTRRERNGTESLLNQWNARLGKFSSMPLISGNLIQSFISTFGFRSLRNLFLT
ncbi:MAG: hypothetical protein SGCHY_004053, partial [Lobulomycetales sp.]